MSGAPAGITSPRVEAALHDSRPKNILISQHKVMTHVDPSMSSSVKTSEDQLKKDDENLTYQKLIYRDYNGVSLASRVKQLKYAPVLDDTTRRRRLSKNVEETAVQHALIHKY